MARRFTIDQSFLDLRKGFDSVIPQKPRRLRNHESADGGQVSTNPASAGQILGQGTATTDGTHLESFEIGEI